MKILIKYCFVFSPFMSSRDNFLSVPLILLKVPVSLGPQLILQFLPPQALTRWLVTRIMHFISLLVINKPLKLVPHSFHSFH